MRLDEREEHEDEKKLLDTDGDTGNYTIICISV
jgi:hypothetical protein